MNAKATHTAWLPVGPTHANTNGPSIKVTPTKVSNKPTKRPRLDGGANSATNDSANTQRRPPNMPAMACATNQVATQGDSAKTSAVIAGTTAVSHSVLRLPKRWVMVDANGVTTNIAT